MPTSPRAPCERADDGICPALASLLRERTIITDQISRDIDELKAALRDQNARLAKGAEAFVALRTSTAALDSSTLKLRETVERLREATDGYVVQTAERLGGLERDLGNVRQMVTRAGKLFGMIATGLLVGVAKALWLKK